MSLRIFILAIGLAIFGSGVKAAPITVSGTILNHTQLTGGPWVHIKFPLGQDTSVFVDSNGFYRAVINPTISQGQITLYINTCRARDTLFHNERYDSTSFRINVPDLNACSPQITVNGKVLNHNASPLPIMVLFSIKTAQNVIDSTMVDSNGDYRITLNNVAMQGNVYAQIRNCLGNRVSVDTFYAANRQINMWDLNYCSLPSGMHNVQSLNNGVPMQSNSATVLRYKFDGKTNRVNFVDTLRIKGDGYVQFPKDSSEYLLKLMPKKMLFQSFGATYYPNGLIWNSKQSQLIGPYSSSILTINAQPVARRSGRFIVEGSVKVDKSIQLPGFSGRGIHLEKMGIGMIDFQFADDSGRYSFKNLDAGEYQVWIDQCGLPTTISKVELNLSTPSILNKNLFVNQQGVSEREFVSVFDQQNELNEVLVYPNPFSHILKIEGTENFKIDVYTLLGNRIYSGKIEQLGSVVLNTELWQSGTYILRIRNKEKLKTLKIIKH